MLVRLQGLATLTLFAQCYFAFTILLLFGMALFSAVQALTLNYIVPLFSYIGLQFSVTFIQLYRPRGLAIALFLAVFSSAEYAQNRLPLAALVFITQDRLSRPPYTQGYICPGNPLIFVLSLLVRITPSLSPYCFDPCIATNTSAPS